MRSGSSVMSIANPSSCPSRVLHGECLGCVEVAEPHLVIAIPNELVPVHLNTLSPAFTFDPAIFLPSIDADLSTEKNDELLGLLRRFRTSFHCQHTGIPTTELNYKVEPGTPKSQASTL